MNNVIKQYIIISLVLGIGITGTVHASEAIFVPIKKSNAYAKFLKRPQSELSKLIFLIDRFQESDVLVIYDGYEHDPGDAALQAKKYLRKNYQNKMDAERWLKVHSYRSDSGNVMIFKYPDGDTRPVRDVLLEQLDLLVEILQ